MESTLGNIPARVEALRRRHGDRDLRMAEVQQVRRGDFGGLAPDLFNDQFKKPVVANLIDTAARDMAAVLAPLPSFNCSASAGLSDKAKKFADKRTKIVSNYLAHSSFEHQMLRGADQYNSYGLLVLCVTPDLDESMPYILVEDAIGAYPVWNMKGETTEFARVYYRDWFSLCADYPKLEQDNVRNQYRSGVLENGKVLVAKHVGRTGRVVTYLPQMGNVVLEDFDSGLGFCNYVCVQRPGLDDEIRGAYDDVIWVQLARHRVEMLLIEGIDKSVRAPIVVTPDVNEIPYGPDAVVVAQGGVNSIGRARLDMPNQAFSAGEFLKQELQTGAMSPEARSGSVDASVITGRGVQQLMAGFSSQIAAAQTVFVHAFKLTLKMAFCMDEKLFGSSIKEIRGQDSGVPFSLKYNPRKDIDGDHSVDIAYGFASGLDPNRALVFVLQAQSAGLISSDFARRSLPVGINAADEESKIAVETSRQSILQGLSALAQSIPQMTAAGQDPSTIITQMAQFVALLQKGKSVEQAALEALAPKPPPEQPQAAPGGPSAGGPAGFTEAGLPAGLQPDLASEGPNARPDLQSMFAGLSQSGQAVLSGGVSRQAPTAVQ